MLVSKNPEEKSTMQVPASARMDGSRYSPAYVPQMIEVSYHGRARLQPL